MIRIRPIQLLVAAQQAGGGSEGMNLSLRLPLTLAILAAGAVLAFPAPGSASASVLAPEALTRARLIRTEINPHYRLMPGRKLVVTEATSTGVVETLTLVTDWLEPHVVAADNGIYFAICSVRATCPYPGRSAAWPAGSFLPRREALELALRTFLETSASLVVVALPTAVPLWVVFERDDLLASVDVPALLDQLAGNPRLADAELPEVVDRLTRPRLFVPLPILPPPDHTIYAVRLVGS